MGPTEDRILKNYTIVLPPSSGSGGRAESSTEYSAEDAVRRILFRLNPDLPRQTVMGLAKDIINKGTYKVISAIPAIDPPNPKSFQPKQSDTTLRQIADEMGLQGKVKGLGGQEFYPAPGDDPEDDDDDRMEKDTSLKPRIAGIRKSATKERKVVATVALFRKNNGIVEVLVEGIGEDPEDDDYRWMLPGGHIDEIAEDLKEDYVTAAVRELEEETGVAMKPQELTYVCVQDRETKHVKDDILYTGTVPMERSEAKASDEVDYVQWFPIDQLPEMIFSHNLFVERALKRLYTVEQNMPPEIMALPVCTKRGLLIVFEGIDGSGKSSQVDRLLPKLKSKGHDVFYSKWASSDLLSDAIKTGKKERRLTPMLYSMLNAADMVTRYEEEVLPALAENKIVVLDRYIYTSFVRDAIRGTNTSMLNHVYEGFRAPDLMFYCRVPLTIAYQRLAQNKGLAYYGAGLDLHTHTDEGKAAQEYQRLMYERYEEITPAVESCVIVDTSGEIEDIADGIWEVTKESLRGRKGMGAE